MCLHKCRCSLTLQCHFFPSFWESCPGCWRKKQQHLLHFVASWAHVKNPSQLSRRVKICLKIWENPFISTSDRKTGFIHADVWVIVFFFLGGRRAVCVCWGGVHRSGSFSWFADKWRGKMKLISENYYFIIYLRPAICESPKESVVCRPSENVRLHQTIFWVHNKMLKHSGVEICLLWHHKHHQPNINQMSEVFIFALWLVCFALSTIVKPIFYNLKQAHGLVKPWMNCVLLKKKKKGWHNMPGHTMHDKSCSPTSKSVPALLQLSPTTQTIWIPDAGSVYRPAGWRPGTVCEGGRSSGDVLVQSVLCRTLDPQWPVPY